MNFGLDERSYNLLIELVIKPLKEKGAEVYVFGSRATAQHHPFSDLDLLYVLKSNSQISRSEISKIKEDIEESKFPFMVEIVNWDDLAESYRSRVLIERVKI
jgi:predicted nucleotidyltransferase